MRYLTAITTMLITSLTALPAHAFDFENALVKAFGSSDPKDLGGPIFALIGVFALVFFWVALRIGRKRQRRMIEDYDADIKDYATRLRRNRS